MPKHPGGRPTDYEPEFCDMLIEWMSQGNPFCTFGKYIVQVKRWKKRDTPCEATLYNWANQHPEFLEAKRIGKIYERDTWEKLQMRAAHTGEGNITAIIHAMKNKFRKDYGDRTPKGQQQIQLNASMDVKQLVANMKPEDLAQLITAVESRTLELEQGSGNTTPETK